MKRNNIEGRLLEAKLLGFLGWCGFLAAGLYFILAR